MQEGYLFSDTLANNIAISDDRLDLERISDSARITNIANDVKRLPLGYNTKIGQDARYQSG